MSSNQCPKCSRPLVLSADRCVHCEGPSSHAEMLDFLLSDADGFLEQQKVISKATSELQAFGCIRPARRIPAPKRHFREAPVFEGRKWRCPECSTLWKWKPYKPNESGWFQSSDPTVWVPLQKRKGAQFLFWTLVISIALSIGASVT